MAYRLKQAGYRCRPVRGARSYHLYHFHDFSDPEKAVQADRVRRRAIEYMAHKHQNPRFRLLFCWFAALYSTPLFPEAVLVRNLVEFEKVYGSVSGEEWREYQAVLDRNPFLPQVQRAFERV